MAKLPLHVAYFQKSCETITCKEVDICSSLNCSKLFKEAINIGEQILSELGVQVKKIEINVSGTHAPKVSNANTATRKTSHR